jgi:hypothetical protein
MNTTLNKAIEPLREVSRSAEDFANLDPVSIGDILYDLYEYWSDHGLTKEEHRFLEELYKSAHKE